MAGAAVGEKHKPKIEAGKPLVAVEIDGYRPFRNFRAEPGRLTVIIGANASGKSAFFDFLHFLSRAMTEPLANLIQKEAEGRQLFHAGGPERIAFALDLDLDDLGLVRYEAEILGPVDTPSLAGERLVRDVGGISKGGVEPFTLLESREGGTVFRESGPRGLVAEKQVSFTPLRLGLSGAPKYAMEIATNRAWEVLASWRVYYGANVAPGAPIRKPAPTEPTPHLAEDGSNLSAVILWLMIKHREVWEEMQTHVGSAIPDFRSLRAEPFGGRGTAMGLWGETGVPRELTLADLSDGTLRFLFWAVLCLSPSPPPLICVDEPELGLHPRVLPLLAGLFKVASARTQVLIATHSPYFLSQFELGDIAAMRKEDGRAVFVRPESSRALRRLVEEAGAEAIERLHVSEELEVLP